MAVKSLISLVLTAGCLLFIVSCGVWFFFAPRPTIVTFNAALDTQDCDWGEIWTDPWANPQSLPNNTYHFAYTSTPQPNHVTAELVAPLAFFRFDICTLDNQSLTLRAMTLTYQKQKLEIPLSDVMKWECNNCRLILNEEGTITVNSTARYPHLIARDFDKYLRELNVTYHRSYPTIRTLVGWGVLGVALVVLSAVLWLTSRSLFLIVGSTAIIIFAVAHWIYFHYWKLVPLLPLPDISATSGVGYAQHRAFSTISDPILFIAPLVVAGGWVIGLWVLSLLYEKYQRHR